MAKKEFPPCRRGDDWGPHTFEVELAEGVITDCFGWFTVKESLSQLDAGAPIRITTDDPGFEIVDGTHFRLSLTAAQTALLELRSERVDFVADVQFETPAGKIATVEDLDQKFTVTGDVTRATAQP